MELIKKQMFQNQMGKRISDQFMIDEDYNVPDTRPDMSRIVLGVGNAEIEGIKRVENYLYVTGQLCFQILYAADQDEARMASLDGRMPFEEMVYTEEDQNKEFFVANARVEFNSSMIHSRKLSIKAMIELEIGSDQLVDEDTTVDLEGDEQVFKKQKPMQLLKLHTSRKDTYRIKEEVQVPGTKENIGTVLWSDVTNRKLDTKLETDALILEGELQVFCFYESQDGKLDWVEQSVPYEGRIECGGADNQMFHHVMPSMNMVNIDIRTDEDGEMRVLGIEATLVLRIAVYIEEATDILEDVYSLDKKCILETKDTTFEELIMQNHSKCKLNEQLSLPEIKDDILQICHSSGSVQVENKEVTGNGITIEGILHICFLYVKENDQVPFDTWQGMIPFSYVIESNETCQNMLYDIASSLEQLSVTLLGGDEIEVKAILAFHSLLRRPVETKVITDISFEPLDLNELEKRPGIIGYIIKDNDDLWTLAKRYNTTVNSIMEVNELSDENNLAAGDKILIFKENMSIL